MLTTPTPAKRATYSSAPHQPPPPSSENSLSSPFSAPVLRQGAALFHSHFRIHVYLRADQTRVSLTFRGYSLTPQFAGSRRNVAPVCLSPSPLVRLGLSLELR